MRGLSFPTYSPALRLKTGETRGLRDLTPTIADFVRPRLIVPPSKERSPNELLFSDLSKTPDVSRCLSETWIGRPAMLDTTYIMEEFGRECAIDWLPPLLKSSRSRGIPLIPCGTVGNIVALRDAFGQSIDRHAETKMSIVVQLSDIDDPELSKRLTSVPRSLELKPEDCTVIADFTGSDFSDPVIAAPVVQFTLEMLQDHSPWHSIIFQGSHYPETNPAPKDGGNMCWARNEWHAWCLAVGFERNTPSNMIFGDYAADCSKIDFGANFGRAIEHIRYAAGSEWLVERSAPKGSTRARMHGVYGNVVESGKFCGRGFSSADAYIEDAANDIAAPHGDAKTWRQLNTTHHITHVVNDIAMVRGIHIERRVEEPQRQTSLFD